MSQEKQISDLSDRELSEAVAVEIMGWERSPDGKSLQIIRCSVGREMGCPDHGPFDYATNIESAMEVYKWLCQQEQVVSVCPHYSDDDLPWSLTVSMEDGSCIFGHGNQPSRLISDAALLQARGLERGSKEKEDSGP